MAKVGNPNHGKDGKFSSSSTVDSHGYVTAIIKRQHGSGTSYAPTTNRMYSNGKKFKEGVKRTAEEHNTHFSKVVNGHIKKIQARDVPDVRKKYAMNVELTESAVNFLNRKGYPVHGLKK